jgi:hypothetical protein
MCRLAVAAVLAALACGRGEQRPPDHTARDVQERDRLERRLDELLPRDAFVAGALAGGGDVQVALRSALAAAIVGDVARHYLDRVELELVLEKRVHESGTFKVGTLLGKMTAGEWTADVVVHRVRGVLSARSPELGVPAENRLRVQLPVTLERAEGSATVSFRWDARGVAGVVCRDFEVSRTIRGRVLAQEYTVDGTVGLEAGPRSVRAVPVYTRHPYRLRMDLVPESWADVERAVNEQDKLLRCGLGIDPKDVMPKLSQLLRKGFDVRLPRSLFRPVDLPASVGGSVTLWDREVDLMLATEGLEVTAEAVRYRARITAREPPQAP